MNLFSNYQFTKSNIFGFLISLLPISFIAGNMIININVIILILSSIILYGKNTFRINYFFLDKAILTFFAFIVITGIYNDFNLYTNYNDFYSYRGNFATTIKSILFLKYLLLYIVLRFLIEHKNVSLNFFLITCSLSSLFVCFDIFYQYINGKDIFGFETIGRGRKLGGPFGDELIAGGYIQRFSIFAFFTLPIIFIKFSNQFSKYLIPILFSIFAFGIILAGNRMPMLLFLLSMSLIIIFQKQTRKFFIPFVFLFSVIFLILFNSNNQIRTHFLGFHDKIVKMGLAVKNKDFDNKKTPQYLKEFSTFYDTWLMNKYVGGGIKNFRFYCHVRPNIKKDSKFICNMHPHNYYLEILTEIGLIGFAIVVVVFLSTFYLTFIRKYFFISPLNNNNLIIPFIFLFITEIFPIKSTGSFFTTGNSTYLFLILGLMIGLMRKKI